MTNPQQIFDAIGDSQPGVLSALDATQGFHAIKLDEESQPKAASATHKGRFEFKTLPFRLCAAPPTYHAAVSLIFRGLT